MFNKRFFLSPEFKIKVKTGEIIASEYALEKERQFAEIFDTLQSKYQINIYQKRNDCSLEKWYSEPVSKTYYCRKYAYGEIIFYLRKA